MSNEKKMENFLKTWDKGAIKKILMIVFRLNLFFFCLLFRGLSTQRENQDRMFQPCNAVRREFEQIRNTNPQLAQMMINDPAIKSAVKGLKRAIGDEEKESSKNRRQ